MTERDEAGEVFPDWYPGTFLRFCAASSAASLSEMADGFLRAVLKENLGRGANWALVSANFSWSALIACDELGGLTQSSIDNH